MASVSEDKSNFQLCELCKTRDFEELFFPTKGGSEDRSDRTWILKWKPTINNSTRCAFCFLLMESLMIQPRFKGIKFTGDEPCGIRVAAHDTGTVVWRCGEDFEAVSGQGLKGPGWRNEGQELKRAVRHLSVTGSGGGNTVGSSIYPYTEGGDYTRDCLLLARKVLPNELLNRLLRTWMKICNEYHGGICNPPEHDKVKDIGLRVIDVERRCVIPFDFEAEYCALSYCWGIRSFLKLKRNNKDELYKDGALSDDHSELPPLFKDAMHMIRIFNIRYIWIDALCILQDDEADKQVQLPLMNKVYKFAKLTIVGASGDSPWSGLPGVRDNERQVKQRTRAIGKLPVYFRSSHMSRTGAIMNSKWYKRAWTLQEHALSTRLLFVTPQEMFWECNCDFFKESSHDESRFLSGTTIEADYALFGTKKPPMSFSSFQRYSFLMNRVSACDLTYDSDRINCMLGFLSEMSEDFPGGFIWGQPVACFESFLLFSAGVYFDAPHPRRDGFPSWSCSGWKVVISAEITSPYDSGFSDDKKEMESLYGEGCPSKPDWIRREVAWFFVDRENPDSWKEVENAWARSDGSSFYEESKQRWEAGNSKQVLEEMRQKFLNAGIPLNHALAFWTQRVELRVDWDKDRKDVMYGIPGGRGGSSDGFAVRDQLDRVIGFIKLTEEYRKSQPDRLDFILISQHCRWEHKIGPLLDLLHVETRNGINFRVQVIRDSAVRLSEWDNLNPRWELINMA